MASSIMVHRPLPPSLRPSRNRAALLFALALVAPACEHRIEEPAPMQRGVDPSALGKAPEGMPVRCMRATPPTPSRTLTTLGPDPSCPPDPVPVRKLPVLRNAQVSFPDANGASVSVEVAERDDERARGLMYRKSMPEEQGMIFVFEDRENHPFWMHNTCIPLDMMFIDEDGFITGIEENTPTMNDGTFQSGCPSKYVLEVNAGWSRRHGVRAGQKVKIEGL